mgnify:FL=1
MPYHPFLTVLCCFLFLSACSQQTKNKVRVGGSCEGCEAIYESPVPFDALDEVDTLPDFNDPGPRLLIRGVIYEANGKIPAANVILYVYHTNQEGVYPRRGNEKGWARRHGYIRGWVRTNAKGEYRFYTLLPASYPNSTALKHIHPVIKEPGRNEYYIDEFIFDDDPFLKPEERNRLEQRGGNGIVTLRRQGDLLVGIRDIVLGRNIPDYGRTAPLEDTESYVFSRPGVTGSRILQQ